MKWSRYLYFALAVMLFLVLLMWVSQSYFQHNSSPEPSASSTATEFPSHQEPIAIELSQLTLNVSEGGEVSLNLTIVSVSAEDLHVLLHGEATNKPSIKVNINQSIFQLPSDENKTCLLTIEVSNDTAAGSYQLTFCCIDSSFGTYANASSQTHGEIPTYGHLTVPLNVTHPDLPDKASIDYWFNMQNDANTTSSKGVVFSCRNYGGAEGTFDVLVSFGNASFSNRTAAPYEQVSNTEVRIPFTLHANEEHSRSIMFDVANGTDHFEVSLALQSHLSSVREEPIYVNPMIPGDREYRSLFFTVQGESYLAGVLA